MFTNIFAMQNCVKYKCRNYVNASLSAFLRETFAFLLWSLATLRTIKTCVKMSNIMRNCVIEMEIADINLSLLSALPFSFDDEEDHEKAIRVRRRFSKLNCGDSVYLRRNNKD